MADTDEPTAARLIIDGVEVPLRDGMFHVGVDFARERTEQIRRAVDERLDNYARRGWPDAQPQPTIRGEASLDIDYVQRPIRLGGLHLAEPAYLRKVNCDEYPELTKALGRWHASDDPSDPARVFPSWRNLGGGHGRVGWEVVITETDDDLWTWDSWTAALVVLAGMDDRVVGERRCPECRGRGTIDEWSEVVVSGAGRLDGRYKVEAKLTCERCDGHKVVPIELLALVFSAAQGWPWALQHGGVIADRLQAAGDVWGLWLAALLEPRVWGGWVSHPTRLAVAGETVRRLDALLEMRHRNHRKAVDAHAAAFGLVRGPGEQDEALRRRIIEHVEGASVFGGARRALAGPGSTVVVRVDGPVFPGQSVYVNPSNPGVFSVLAPSEREGSVRAGTIVGVVSDGLATLAPAHGVAVNSAGEAMLVEQRAGLSAGYTALQPSSLRAAITRAGVMAYPDDRRLGWTEYRPVSEVFSEADIERLAGVPAVGEVRVRGDGITLTFNDDEPHVVTTETVRRNLERLASERPEDPDTSERPHSPPIGRGLSRRLERGRRR